MILSDDGIELTLQRTWANDRALMKRLFYIRVSCSEISLEVHGQDLGADHRLWLLAEAAEEPTDDHWSSALADPPYGFIHITVKFDPENRRSRWAARKVLEGIEQYPPPVPPSVVEDLVAECRATLQAARDAERDRITQAEREFFRRMSLEARDKVEPTNDDAGPF